MQNCVYTQIRYTCLHNEFAKILMISLFDLYLKPFRPSAKITFHLITQNPSPIAKLPL